MRRYINKPTEPMSLQEARGKEEESQQRVHAAEGVLATAEKRMSELTAHIEETSQKLKDVQGRLDEAKKNFKEQCEHNDAAYAEGKRLEGVVQELKNHHQAAIDESAMVLTHARMTHADEREAHNQTMSVLVADQEDARKNIADMKHIIERLTEDSNAAQSKLDRLKADEVKLLGIPVLLSNAEAELSKVTNEIINRGTALKDMTERQVELGNLLVQEERKLQEAKQRTEKEEHDAQEIRVQLAAKEEEVAKLIASQQAIQASLETMRGRMLRMEKDAEAKEFLNRGY
jgi:chromosome segregation ATPase